MNEQTLTEEEETQRAVKCEVDAGFAQWLAQSGGSVAVTTYQAGKVALVGWDARRACVHFTMRHFRRPMGMTVDHAKGRMALATATELLLLSDAPLLAHDYLGSDGKYDALYLPRASYYTGPLNLHDLAFGCSMGTFESPGEAGGCGNDTLWAVNTRFGCLVTPNDQYSFIPRWHPKFLSVLAPEDRCHLNGLAMRDGQPAFVTALGSTDTPRGWSENKKTGGILMDIDSNEIILDGLCMPHSPRWYDNKLWLLNSGRGELCIVDPQSAARDVIAELPGYARGLYFVGHHALIGLSKVRKKHVFAGLPIQEKYPELSCAVAVVDTQSGQTKGMLTFTEAAEELYDVAFIPGIHTPTILNTQRSENAHAVTTPDFSYWLEMKKEEESNRQDAKNAES